MPRVSVIVPVYNQAAYLPVALDSVLAQSHPDVELVVVDDGSTDGTAAVIAGYAGDPRVTAIRQENAGVGVARNRGFAVSTGELVCFLDADDYYHPGKLAAQVAQFARDPQLGLVYCDIVAVNESGGGEDGYRVAQSRAVLSGDIFGSLVMGGYFPPHVVMVRRDVFAASGGFDPDLHGHADLDLWLRLAGTGVRAEFLPEALGYYRRHDAGMSRDLEEMRRTRRLTLARAAEAWPARVAAAISDLQDVDAELHAANSWLREQLQPLLEQLDGGMPWAVIDVLAAVPQARDLVGAPPCVWEVEIEGAWKRAVMLHPPAAVTVEIADSGRGRVQGLVALHPDVWDRPNVGPCRFELMVDSAVGAVRVIDPRRADHRRWVEIELAVPAGASGHVITLRTDGIGGIEHRWALWAELTYERTCA